VKRLNISADLAIPQDIVTSTVIIYGGKGMGKTNLGSVIVEELANARLRWSVLDPMGVFWGLRHSADGKGPGVECVILGGPHGDIPIEPTGGATVADLVIDESANTIIDFSRKASGQMWSKGEKIRFVTEYANRLFERQGQLVGGRRREPLLQILDEAARYIPQMIPANSPMLAESVGAWEQIAEEGRNIGLGIAFLTQRSARMNKSVSELADVMFAFRTVGPNSVRAVVDWLGEHIEKDRVRDVAGKVRELEVGQALIVSPGWLRVEKIAKIRERQTFDSSATPKPGQQRRRVTGPAAKPDLQKYRERMLETIEKAKESDPKELKKRVAELTGRIRQLEKGGATTKTVDKPVVDQAAVDRAVKAAVVPLRRALEDAMKFIINISTQNFDVAGVDKAELERAVGAAVAKAAGIVEQRLESRARQIEQMRTNAGKIVTALKKILQDDKEVEISVGVTKNPPFSMTAPAPAREPQRPREPRPARSAASGSGEQRILNAIAELNSLGIERTTRAQVGIVAEYNLSGGSPAGYVASLVGRGQVKIPAAGELALTDEGRAIASAEGAPLTLADLHRRALAKLSDGERRILEYLISIYPEQQSRADVGAAVGYNLSGGSPAGYVAKLTGLSFATIPAAGQLRAGDLLFPEGLS